MNILNMLKTKTSRTLAAGVMVAGLMAANTANATLIVKVCDSATCAGVSGTNWISTSDGGGGDTSGAAGRVRTAELSLGAFTIFTETANTYPLLGSPALPHLDLSVDWTSSGSGTVWVFASEVGFLAGGIMDSAISTTHSSGTTSVSWADYWDAGNTQFAATTLLSDFGTTGFSGVSSGSGELFANLGNAGAYSLTLVGKITTTGASHGVSQETLEILSAPEPATLGLLGLGLLGLGGAARRRKAA